MEEEKVSFETIKSEIREFGRNNFIEIARKRAVKEDGNATEFLSLTRGYYGKDGSRKYKATLTLPDDPETKRFLADVIGSL